MLLLIDTKVLISAILYGGKPQTLLTAILRGEAEVASSETLLDELEDVLVRKGGFSRPAARQVRDEVSELAFLVEPKRIRKVCRDPGDDHVLAAAREAGVDLLVTGDRDLLGLGTYEGIEILTPVQAVKRLESAT